MFFLFRQANETQKSFILGPKKGLKGGGKGNDAAGPMWTAISIIILLIIEAFCVKATFVSALFVVIFQLAAIMYVDDTDLSLTASYNTPFMEIGRREQLLVLKRCNTLWVTGRCLIPEKCMWSIIAFKWDEDVEICITK